MTWKRSRQTAPQNATICQDSHVLLLDRAACPRNLANLRDVEAALRRAGLRCRWPVSDLLCQIRLRGQYTEQATPLDLQDH